MDETFHPLHERFYSKFRDHNLLEEEITDFTKLLISGLSKQKKIWLKVVGPLGS